MSTLEQRIVQGKRALAKAKRLRDFAQSGVQHAVYRRVCTILSRELADLLVRQARQKARRRLP